MVQAISLQVARTSEIRQGQVGLKSWIPKLCFNPVSSTQRESGELGISQSNVLPNCAPPYQNIAKLLINPSMTIASDLWNLMSNIRKVSGEIDILQSSVLRHFHSLGKTSGPAKFCHTLQKYYKTFDKANYKQEKFLRGRRWRTKLRQRSKWDRIPVALLISFPLAKHEPHYFPS